MPNLPTELFKAATKLKDRTPAEILRALGTSNTRGIPASKDTRTVVPRYGSVKPVDAHTLAETYNNGSYSDPGIAFGPGTPPAPMPMDDTGQPRRDQYRPGRNLISNPGEGRVDYNVLQALADNYDLFRAAILVRIDEIACLDWDISPDPLVARTVADKRDMRDKYRKELIAARQFFKKPDRVNVFQRWIRNVLEDHFIFDAITIYKRRTRGNQLYSLEYLDGGLIKPITNLQGRLGEPPDIAYQQYLFGKPVFDFTIDELIYMPKNVRPRTVYGFSIVEQFLLHINLALRFQAWNTAFFTDGNIPSRLLTAPEKWSSDKIEEWQMLFDAMIAGDPAAQRKLFMIPPGVEEIGGGNEGMFDYAIDFSNYLIDITCVATGVTREELGLEPGNSDGLGGSGLHEAMEGVHNRRLVRLSKFLADTIFTPLLQEEFDLPDFVWTWPSLKTQDPQAEAELTQLKLFGGQISFDDMLMEQGEEPVGIGRMINVEGKLLFEQDLLRLQEKGSLAYEEEQAQSQAQIQTDSQKEIAEHGASLQQQSAEHQSGLNQQEAEHASTLQQQQAEAQHALELEKMQTQGDMAKDQAEHQSTLAQQQAEQAHGFDQEKMQAQGDQSRDLEEHKAGLAQQQTQQEQGFSLQQMAQEHQAQQQAAQQQSALKQQEAAHGSGLKQQEAVQGSGLKQQEAVHGSGLKQQEAAFGSGLKQQEAIQGSTLGQQDAEHTAGLQQQATEQEATVQQAQATHEAGLQQQQTEQEHGLAQENMQLQGDMDLSQARQEIQLSQEEMDHEAQIAAEQSKVQHKRDMEQSEVAHEYSQEQLKLQLKAKTQQSATKSAEPELTKGHNGVMVALRVPKEAAEQLTVSGGLPAEEMHITLAYLGKTSTLAPGQAKTLKRVVENFAHSHAPLLDGSAGQTGVFPPSPSSDDLEVLYREPAVPGLIQFRAELVKELKKAGLDVATTFSYTPHITLRYQPEGTGQPTTEVPNVDLAFKSVALHIGDDQQEYALSAQADEDFLRKGAQSEQSQEIEQWRRKVEKGLKAGKTPARVPFTPNFLTPELTKMVAAGLAELEQPAVADVRAVFRSASVLIFEQN